MRALAVNEFSDMRWRTPCVDEVPLPALCGSPTETFGDFVLKVAAGIRTGARSMYCFSVTDACAPLPLIPRASVSTRYVYQERGALSATTASATCD